MAFMSEAAVDIKNIAFTYPRQSTPLFSNINLKINAGDRFGLFGPNGAGKTTLMNLMTGLLSYNKGSIQLAGQEIKSHHKSVNKLFGFVPQDFSFYHELTPVENLEFFGAWSGLLKKESKERINELLEILGLSDVKNKQVNKFSGGMKRRMNLAIGIIHHPSILFLDEPTVGVDVQTRHAIINYLKELNKSGTTLIYTSHQLSEAEGLCKTIALMDEGKIIAFGSLDDLLFSHNEKDLEGLFLKLTGKDYRDSDV
jgi:ABC-2 type transport system ATP-binding protein